MFKSIVFIVNGPHVAIGVKIVRIHLATALGNSWMFGMETGRCN